uniref:Uncharacterized protein n=1 Tax=Rhizophora mucronata TaxID=61149 RepID=A0A2P2QC53_RHIMU
MVVMQVLNFCPHLPLQESNPSSPQNKRKLHVYSPPPFIFILICCTFCYGIEG